MRYCRSMTKSLTPAPEKEPMNASKTHTGKQERKTYEPTLKERLARVKGLSRKTKRNRLQDTFFLNYTAKHFRSRCNINTNFIFPITMMFFKGRSPF